MHLPVKVGMFSATFLLNVYSASNRTSLLMEIAFFFFFFFFKWQRQGHMEIPWPG